MSDTLTPDQADHAMRHWTYRSTGQIRIGSAAHKRMFCEMLLTTHNPYKPVVIDWPVLAPAALNASRRCLSGTSRCRRRAARRYECRLTGRPSAIRCCARPSR